MTNPTAINRGYNFTLKTSRGDITITVQASSRVLAFQLANMLVDGKLAHYSDTASFSYTGAKEA